MPIKLQQYFPKNFPRLWGVPPHLLPTPHQNPERVGLDKKLGNKKFLSKLEKIADIL